MPGFFLISGYFGRKPLGNGQVFPTLLNKAQAYLLPLASWYLIVQVLILGRYDHNILAALMAFTAKVDGTLWFLWVSFILSAIFIGVNRLVRKGGAKEYVSAVLYLLVVYAVILLAGLRFGIKLLGIKFILYYSIFYGIGYVARFFREKSNGFDVNKSVKDVLFAVAVLVFAAVICNVDLYTGGDGLMNISYRLIAGLCGMIALMYVVKRYQSSLQKTKLPTLGRYTLEVYCTHMYLNNLMSVDNMHDLCSVMGFVNFTAGLITCSLFTYLVIVILKSNRITNRLFYGK